MSISSKRAKSLLSHEEWVLVETTLRPKVSEVAEADLRAAGRQLRTLHNRERDLSRAKRRVARGKAEPRGGSFPGTYARPAERTQVFAQALIRVNDEIVRREGVAARTAMLEGQQRVLAAKRAAPSRRPANNPTAGTGPSSIPNSKRTTRVPGAKVGSVSQQGKRSQARKDG
jgi:hypothetical protein